MTTIFLLIKIVFWLSTRCLLLVIKILFLQMTKLSLKFLYIQQSRSLHSCCICFQNLYQVTNSTATNTLPSKVNKKPTQTFINEVKEIEKKRLDQTQQKLDKNFSNLVFSLTEQTIPKAHLPSLSKKASLVVTKSFKSSHSHLFLKSFEDPFNFLEERKSNLPLNEKELKRLFIYQYVLQNEIPGKAELPLNADENNFLENPKEWEKKLLKSPLNDIVGLRFAMIKWAAKNKKLRKKIKKQNAVLCKNLIINDVSYNQMLFPKFSKAQVRRFFANKITMSNQFNQPLIFDMRFHKNVDQSSISFIRQMDLVIAKNLCGLNPFHVVLCNFDKNTEFYKYWIKDKPESLLQSMTITNKGLNDLKLAVGSEDLIYLTPDSPSVMSEFNHNKAYVIGGLVDRDFQKQRTQTISKLEHITSERLPLDRYLMWGGYGGKKELTVNTVFDILFSLKSNDCWINALSSIPYRLHRGLSEMGKEVANYDADVIARFDKGNQWKMKKDKKAPNVQISIPKFCNHNIEFYLGKV